MVRRQRATSEPDFIYGTAWKEEETASLTRLAIAAGFRAIDTANQRRHYVEAAVGEAIAGAIDDGLVERRDLFVQTKFTYERGQDHRLPYDADAPVGQQVEQSFDSSLEHLQTDYVDALLLHGPSSRTGLSSSDREVWEAMEDLVATDAVGAIGVSNVTARQLELLLEEAETKPAYVQNRCFARTGWDRRVREICAAHQVTYQGFSLLTANTRELRTEAVARIAERYGKTVPQIVFRFAIDVGMIPLTGTTSREHMDQDLAIVDFELDEAEVETIEALVAG